MGIQPVVIIHFNTTVRNSCNQSHRIGIRPHVLWGTFLCSPAVAQVTMSLLRLGLYEVRLRLIAFVHYGMRLFLYHLRYFMLPEVLEFYWKKLCFYAFWGYFILLSLICHVVGQDSAVGIATGYGLDGSGIKFRWGWDFPHPSRLTLGPTQVFPRGKVARMWWPPTPISFWG